MKKLQLLISFLVLISFNISAQEKYLNDLAETQKLSKEVAELFSENKIAPAFDKLTLYWPMPQNELEAIEEKIIKYLNIIKDRFGKSIGVIKVKK